MQKLLAAISYYNQKIILEMNNHWKIKSIKLFFQIDTVYKSESEKKSLAQILLKFQHSSEDNN